MVIKIASCIHMYTTDPVKMDQELLTVIRSKKAVQSTFRDAWSILFTEHFMASR